MSPAASTPGLLCPTCHEKYGRVWRVRDEDRYCGLCGSKLRLADIQHDDITEETPLCWFTGSGAPTAKFTVRKTGTLPITGLRLSISGLAIEPVEFSLKDAVQLVAARLDVPCADGSRFHVDGGNLLSPPLDIVVRHAPKSLWAHPSVDDKWAVAVAEESAAPKSQIDFKEDAGGEWASSTVVPLLVDLDAVPPSAKFLVSATNLPAEFYEAVLHGQTVLQIKKSSVNCQVRCEGDDLEVTIPVAGLDVAAIETSADEKLEGNLEIKLRAVGSPRIKLPNVHIYGGRPAWKMEKQRQQRLPSGVFSLVRVNFGTAAIQSRENSSGLDLSKSKLKVAVPLGWEAQYRPDAPGRGAEQMWVLFIKPPLGETEGNLKLRLWAPGQDGDEWPLGPVQELECQVYDRGTDIGGDVEAVVDFGTSNTCVSLSRGGIAQDCAEIHGIGGRDLKVIPTIVAVWNTEPDGLPHYCIGQPAWQLAVGASVNPEAYGEMFAAFNEFKTLISDPNIRSQSPFVGTPPEHFDSSPENLTYLFLRELILELRAQPENQNRRLGRLQLTYPSTFTMLQRAALSKIVTRVAGEVAGCPVGNANADEAGLRGHLIIDEANAGAYEAFGAVRNEQLPQYVVLIDWGGGTLDIAILAITYDRDTGIKRVRPLGMTGIRKLGGQNVTAVMAKLLSDAFAKAFSAAKNNIAGKFPIGKDDGHTKSEAKAARLNEQAIRRFAEHFKVSTYGKPVEDYSSDWYNKLGKDLLNDAEYIKDMTINPHLWIVKEDKEQQWVDTELLKEWLRDDSPQIKLTRANVDREIRPALEEAADRAVRLWERVRDRDRVQRERPNIQVPDRIVLAGSSSRLPLLRKVLEEKFPDCRKAIEFDPGTAKTRVANGAVQYRLTSIYGGNLILAECQNFILLPLCLKRPDAYTGLFDCGAFVESEPSSETTTIVSLPVYHGVYTLQVSRDIDLQPTDTTNSALAKLKIDDDGKERLFSEEVPVPIDGTNGSFLLRLKFELIMENHRKKLTIDGFPDGSQKVHWIE